MSLNENYSSHRKTTVRQRHKLQVNGAIPVTQCSKLALRAAEMDL